MDRDYYRIGADEKRPSVIGYTNGSAIRFIQKRDPQYSSYSKAYYAEAAWLAED